MGLNLNPLSIAVSAVMGAVNGALADVANNPATPLQPGQVPAIVRQVEATVQAALPGIPELQHATNSEPWYQSRVTLGALASAVGPLLAVTGHALSPELVDASITVWLAVGPAAIGAVYTLYGRWIAKRPIGA